MKQKKLNDILYVFDITPYQITEDTDAEVIKVQEECYAGYVELNQDLADKIVKYNYHIACVNTPEWAPYVDGDQPEPQTGTNLLVVNSIDGANPLGGDNIWDATDSEWAKNLDYYDATDCDDHFDITLAVGHDYNIFNATIEYMTTGEQVDDHYDFTMPDDVVYCSVAEPQPETYTFSLTGSNIHSNIVLKINDEQASYTAEELVDGVQLSENDNVKIYPQTELYDYQVTSGYDILSYVWDDVYQYWTFDMPAEDTTIEIDYVNEYELQGVGVAYYVKNNSEALPLYFSIGESMANTPDAMYVNGLPETPSATYQFEYSDINFVQYIFNDHAFDIKLTDPDLSSVSNIVINDIVVGEDITSVVDECWDIKSILDGESDATSIPQIYWPTTPPTITSAGASQYEKPAATIYVPDDSVSAYQAASEWSDISALIQGRNP